METILRQLRESLPSEIVDVTREHLSRLEKGDYAAVLSTLEARRLFGHVSDASLDSQSGQTETWNNIIFRRLSILLSDRSKSGLQVIYFCVGYAALLAFLQSNVTGPPLPFDPAKLLLAENVASNPQTLKNVRASLLASLTTDGIAAYKLTPNIELFCLADAILTCPSILKEVAPARWSKMRVAFVHQRLLSEVSATLEKLVYQDLAFVEEQLTLSHASPGARETKSEFLLERAIIHLHHGLDRMARADLEQARADRKFEYALTGRLGKRTRYQQRDISQLVVLATSADAKSPVPAGLHQAMVEDSTKAGSEQHEKTATDSAQPESLDLHDDTLLEKIAFSGKPRTDEVDQNGQPLSSRLAALDPSNQPQLDPLDASILLCFASSITNTSPESGLTREETLPYATRVIEGGSSNWQVYTQALLVRSRIEGHKSRTVERGLLQLQALVDQVIADTTPAQTSVDEETPSRPAASTFLPRAKEAESAPATDRLRYIFQLASPTRWDIEAELAARWVQLGGLRSALEIYERLEMWAEAALCWAATQREDKAKKIVRRQLFHSTMKTSEIKNDRLDDEDDTWEGPLREPPPPDAPRLYCILGDMDQSIEMYETAWEVSRQRYARAQRSIGRLHFAARDHVKAAEAYSKSLKVNQLNRQAWFALGCALIELNQYGKAVEAFSRCVQLDETDAEAWSNLAAALLRLEPDQPVAPDQDEVGNDEDAADSVSSDKHIRSQIQRNRSDALKAFQRAATLKHDSYRIWQNVLVTAASLSPPDYVAALSAQRRVIDLRGGSDGEKCIDAEILEKLVQYIIDSAETFDASQPGVVRMTVRFMDESVVPLITASADLWRLVSKLAIWRKKPGSALDAEEKAWRAVTTQPGWETESEQRWNDVVDATVRLCDSYESLGSVERTEGLGAGQPVAKDWKFKARSAIRGIMNRGKDSWQDTDGWERLNHAQEGLKTSV